MLREALEWAGGLTEIGQLERDIIMNAKNTLLFSRSQPWCKKEPPNFFDVTMGSFDGAETCELVGLYILQKLSVLGVDLGLYQDDGLGVSSKPKRAIENLKKKICKIFSEIGLRITIEANLSTVDFLDVTMDLKTGLHRPYTKPNNTI